MKTKFLLVEVPANWKCNCTYWKGKKEECPRCKDYPLRIARIAVKVQGGISRAIATQFDKEVEVYAVEARYRLPRKTIPTVTMSQRRLYER